MQTKKLFLYSLVVSLILHLVFLAGSTRIRLSGIDTVVGKTKKIFNLKSVDVKLAEKKPVIKRETIYTRATKFQQPGYSKIDSEQQKTIPKKIKADTKKSKLSVKEKNFIFQKEYLDKQPEIIRKKESFRKTKTKLVQFSTEGMQVFNAADIEEIVKKAELPENFKDKMPGFTPTVAGGLDDPKHKSFDRFAQGYKPFVAKDSKLGELTGYLVSHLSTYHDSENNESYFKLTIRTGPEADVLNSLSKEIIFLIDSSLSIRPQRLQNIKKGILYCLNNLGHGDRFNIIAFRDQIHKLSPQSIVSSKHNIAKAEDFVEKIKATKQTDIYNVLNKSLETRSGIKPVYMILFTDGYPTKGVVNPTKIISNISKKNNGEKAIFSFGAGREINRYLLDFISYKNRGWTEYAANSTSIKTNIMNMYNKIKEPILINVRHNVKGISSENIFPKVLHDIYKNTEFTLYGKYSSQTEFVMQLTGESRKATNEFIVVGSLEDAAQAGAEIAQEWALNKIYYLTGLLNYGESDKKIIKEIQQLSKKFNIATPYIYRY
jgi:uncharacterized protein YegL